MLMSGLMQNAWMMCISVSVGVVTKLAVVYISCMHVALLIHYSVCFSVLHWLTGCLAYRSGYNCMPGLSLWATGHHWFRMFCLFVCMPIMAPIALLIIHGILHSAFLLKISSLPSGGLGVIGVISYHQVCVWLAITSCLKITICHSTLGRLVDWSTAYI